MISSFIDSMGNGLFLSGSVLYLTRAVHLSNAQVTVGLTVAGLIGFLTTVPVSVLGDRTGAGRLLVALQFWKLIGFVGYAFVGNFTQYLAASAFIALGDRVAQPVLQTVVGAAVTEERRVATMAWIRSTRNAGLASGALLASFAVTVDSLWGYRAIILADAATFLASGLLLLALRLPGRTRDTGKAPASPWALLRTVAKERRYLGLTLLNGLLSFHTVMLSVGIPLWVSQHTSLPTATIPVLIAVNTVLAVTLQPWAARGVSTLTQAARRCFHAGLALAAACLQFALVPESGAVAAAVLLTTAVVCHTLGEVWQSAGGWEISYALSPKDQRGTYLGVFSLGPTGAQIIGPTVVVLGVVGSGPPGWILLGAAFAATGWLVRTVCRRA
ncbi:MFS transporter [Streptomyces sp. NPDC048442]|uniref:MFS transporter n=1 Tax=Streptomyces sp. NPDC048442 TaxID=3154823 RepID=UPI00344A8794